MPKGAKVPVVALALLAALGLWLALSSDRPGPGVSEGEAEPPAASAAGGKPLRAPEPTEDTGGAGAGSRQPSEPPDLDDAPVRFEQAEIDRMARERGLRVIEGNIDDLQEQLRAADEAGETAKADLMRRRIVLLHERRERLEEEGAAAEAAEANGAQAEAPAAP